MNSQPVDLVLDAAKAFRHGKGTKHQLLIYITREIETELRNHGWREKELICYFQHGGRRTAEKFPDAWASIPKNAIAHSEVWIKALMMAGLKPNYSSQCMGSYRVNWDHFDSYFSQRAKELRLLVEKEIAGSYSRNLESNIKNHPPIIVPAKTLDEIRPSKGQPVGHQSVENKVRLVDTWLGDRPKRGASKLPKNNFRDRTSESTRTT